MKVTIYTTTACPYCKMLKDYFDESGISYEEKMVDNDEEARALMVKDSNGFMGVPFTVVVKENGEKESIVGFDKEKINRVLGL